MCIRVTEVGKFSKFVVSKSSYKSSPNIWCLLGLFCKTYRFKSQCVCLLLGNFWKIWSIFIRKSGHTDPHTFSFKKPFNIWLTKTTSSSCLKMRIEKKLKALPGSVKRVRTLVVTKCRQWDNLELNLYPRHESFVKPQFPKIPKRPTSYTSYKSIQNLAYFLFFVSVNFSVQHFKFIWKYFDPSAGPWTPFNYPLGKLDKCFVFRWPDWKVTKLSIEPPNCRKEKWMAYLKRCLKTVTYISTNL